LAAELADRLHWAWFVIGRVPSGSGMSGHGGTGTLLYCHVAGVAIDRRYDQSATNCGKWFAFDRTSRKLLRDGWQSIDSAAGEIT
jgi:hypothetical protein